MKDIKKENLLLAALWALAGAFLVISGYKVFVTGPLREVLAGTAARRMMAEVAVVFAWNLFCLSGTSARRLKLPGLLAGVFVFTWCHQIFLPMAVSFIYMAVLVLWGRWIHRLLRLKVNAPSVESMSMCLVSGSAFWMVFVCILSLTGHGGLKLWRLCALALGLSAAAGEGILLVRRYVGNKDRETGDGAFLSSIWMPETRTQAWLLAFIITMVLIQAGRLNISLDYDSLHYGLRSAFVLDNGRGIYENLGMVNLVYTYSKGLEVLMLPLSGTPTYGLQMAFSLWTAVAVLALGAWIAGRGYGIGRGLFAAAILSSIPGIMNMAATAKSDIITLLHQLIIYNFLCRAFEEKGRVPWLSMAIATYLLTMVYKPTALVFSTALGGVALICLITAGRFTLGNLKGCLLLVLPAGAVAGLWYRTWLMTGVPVTSIFAGLCEKLGWSVRYPYTFRHVIGDASVLTAGEKFSRLFSRLGEMLLAPVSMDMDHVIIAWGTGLVTLFLFIWTGCAWTCRPGKTPLEVFNRVLIPVLGLGCVASIYTLSQVDGNYFILFYALLVISALRMAGGRNRPAKARGLFGAGRLGRALRLVIMCFMVSNVPVTCLTSWAGNPGFTPVSLRHKGYYSHRRDAKRRREEKGSRELTDSFGPRTRVLAFGDHPGVLELPCSVQSYYDVTGSGGNVYLVKKLAYFEEFLEYAGTEYFYVEAGYLAAQPRALQMIEDMIAEGSLTDIRYEWGNMTARVELPGTVPKDPRAAVEDFRRNYRMTAGS